MSDTATTTDTASAATGSTTDGGNAGKAFEPITSQEDFDARLSDRLKRERAKFADYNDLKARADEADKLRKEQETASEKAVREAREQAAAEERAKNAPRLVSAEFRAAAKGVLDADTVAGLLEDLDLTKYLTDKGEVDVEKVEKRVNSLAPKSHDTKGSGRFPDLGQGRRGEQVKGKGAAGAAEAERRFATAKK